MKSLTKITFQGISKYYGGPQVCWHLKLLSSFMFLPATRIKWTMLKIAILENNTFSAWLMTTLTCFCHLLHQSFRYLFQTYPEPKVHHACCTHIKHLKSFTGGTSGCYVYAQALCLSISISNMLLFPYWTGVQGVPKKFEQVLKGMALFWSQMNW